jgi:mycothiol synthase
VPLPQGYILRHPEPEEAPAVQAVMDAAESADVGEPRRHMSDVASEWRDPECRPAENWRVAVAPGGIIAAVGWVWPETSSEVTADHYVHPEHRGRGLGEAMLDAIETRAAELQARRVDGAPRRLVVWCEDSDVTRRAALDRRCFTAVRQYFEMEIRLVAGRPSAPWPPGIDGRGFRPGVDDRRVWKADIEAFSEHHLFEARSFEEWRLHHLEKTDSDPTLWWLAWDGDELAGYVTAALGEQGAVIGDLAVRKPWRGRGIGRALLLAAFQTLRERGPSVARLMVDAQNTTNAVRVYEAAGMHVARRFDVMQRPLA